nr:hypothetical protein [Salibacterium qingdaonense]
MNDMARETIIREVVGEIYDAFPNLLEDLEEQESEQELERLQQENAYHLDNLEATYEMDNIEFFLNYTEWLDNVLTSRNVDRYMIIDNFERLQRLIPGNVEEEEEGAYVMYLESAIDLLKERQDDGDDEADGEEAW